MVKQDLKSRLPLVPRDWDALEQQAMAAHPSVEQKALTLWKSEPTAARALLTRHCADLAAEADQVASKWVERLGGGQR